MLNEIGGYIEFEYFRGREYHGDAIALNSGRHCLEYIVKARQVGKLYIPYFLCDSVKGICDRLGLPAEYYHTDIHLLPVCDFTLSDGDWLYIVNYYGQLSNRKIAELKKISNNIIVDNVQSFFQTPVDGVDTLYSCRKFFGVTDGAYLYTDADTSLYQALERDTSYDKMEFLFGRMEKTAGEFYAQYVQNNKRFINDGLKAMSKSTQNILRGLDYNRIESVRTANFEFLHTRLNKHNKLNISVPDGAFMYPRYTSKTARR